MKEHLIIKGMDFIGNQLIKVQLIPDPEYTVEETIPTTDIDYRNLNTVCKSVNQILNQKQERERIVFIGVEEWIQKKYGFASKVILNIEPGG